MRICLCSDLTSLLSDRFRWSFLRRRKRYPTICLRLLLCSNKRRCTRIYDVSGSTGNQWVRSRNLVCTEARINDNRGAHEPVEHTSRKETG
jgi:hypothetical protein